MQVTVVNQYYPPDTSATAAVFADIVGAFADQGHDVTVICGRPSYAPGERHPWRLLTRRRTGRVTVERVGSTGFDRYARGGRIANYLSFMVLAFARLLVSRSDVVVVGSDPPIAVMAAVMAARRPVVYSLRDLHPDFALATGMVGRGRVTEYWEHLHGAALRRCAAIICLGDDMARRVIAKNVAPHRVHVIRDGADLAAPRAVDPAVVAQLRGQSHFVAMHAGNIGGTVPRNTLMHAASRLTDDVELMFVGDGVYADDLRAAGARVEPFRPAREVASVMAAGDVQIVAMREGLEGLVVPSKLYTALAHRRPVVAVVPDASDVAAIVREYGCGVVVGPDDGAGLAAALKSLSQDPARLAIMAQRAGAAAGAFDRAKEIDAFSRLVSDIASH